VRRRQSQAEPLLSPTRQVLRCAPRHQAPMITCAEVGEPLRMLRRWNDPGGGRWLHVELVTPGSRRRGWLPG